MGKARKLTALLLMLGLLASLLCGCVTIPAAPSQSPAQEQLTLLPNDADTAPAEDGLTLLPEESAAPAEDEIPAPIAPNNGRLPKIKIDIAAD